MGGDGLGALIRLHEVNTYGTHLIAFEKDAILEIKRRVSISNIIKNESTKSRLKQITLTIKPMIVENKTQ